MKVTAITVQQNDPNRVNIMVDGKFRFSLDIFQITGLGVRVGKDYTDTELIELETESQFGKLYARALEYCLMRPHSSREIKDYLHKKTFSKKYKSRRTGELKERPGVSVALTERVFDRLLEKGYVDDENFARYWVENRNQRKGSSLRKLQAELMSKGVDTAVISAQLADSNRNDEEELQKVIAKRRKKYDDEQKFMQYLARQGFSYDAIKAALANAQDV